MRLFAESWSKRRKAILSLKPALGSRGLLVGVVRLSEGSLVASVDAERSSRRSHIELGCIFRKLLLHKRQILAIMSLIENVCLVFRLSKTYYSIETHRAVPFRLNS